MRVDMLNVWENGKLRSMKTSECCLAFSEILRTKKYEIIEEWVIKVTSILEIANEQSKPVLIDHLPEVISNLSDILELEGRQKTHAQEIKKRTIQYDDRSGCRVALLEKLALVIGKFETHPLFLFTYRVGRVGGLNFFK